MKNVYNAINSQETDDTEEKGGPNEPQTKNGELVAETNSPKSFNKTT